MGISSAMNAGVMGLNVNSSKLSTIADNIANSETKGYKRTTMEFSSLVLTERPTSYDSGGVRAATVRYVDDQGALLSTRNNMDLAISGRGFLPVTDVSAIQRGETDLPGLLMRTGSFRPDENGIMRTNSGYALMGYKAVDGEFPTNVARESSEDLVPVNIGDIALAAEPTRNISLGANLDARVTGLNSEELPEPVRFPVEYFDILGGSEKIDFQFMPSNTAQNQWFMRAFDMTTGSILGAFDIEFSNSTNSTATPPTLAGYIQSVSARTIYDMPPTVLPGTSIGGFTSGSASEASRVGFLLPADPGTFLTEMSEQVEIIESVASVDGDGNAILDGDGNPVFEDVVTGQETQFWWTNGLTSMRAADRPDESFQQLYRFEVENAGVTSTFFTTAAELTTVRIPPSEQGTWSDVTGALTLTLPDGISRSVTLGRPGMAGPLSQFKAQSGPSNITKDGSPVSEVIGIEINESGVMDAIFSSGFRKSIYKIPIGAVQNPNGLNALDGQVYTLSRASGSVYFYDAGAGPTGRLVSNALEESTTDIAEELTQLIKTQRAYSSNAKIIQTVDEMLQETTNLKR